MSSVLIALMVTAWAACAAALLASAFSSYGCAGKKGMNVLLITLDTTRADHLRCYGYDRIETPNLNRLARDGVLFERAYSHIPLTLPAHTSILSGTVPTHHGVADNGSDRVPDDLITMAEILKDHGYNTSAFISAAVLNKVWNLDQGFDHWDEEDITPQAEDRTPLVSDRKADVVTKAATEWLRENSKKKFFMWVHYYDPHAQYDPPQIYKDLYASLYDGEIAFMDQEIGSLLDTVDELGLRRNTVVIAVGDHGESLGQHNEQTHAVFIYEATQHVPLIMRIPGLQDLGIRIKTVVSQKDLLPTVLDYLQIEIPPQVTGESLRPMIESGSGPRQRFAFLESRYSFLHYNWAPLTSLVGQRYKYIKAPKPELYDLTKDPLELDNIAEKEPKTAAQMKARLEKLEQKYGRLQMETQEAEVTPEMRRQLEALGYVAGNQHGDLEKALEKDPKDYTDILPYLMRTNQAWIDKDYQKLIELTNAILEKDPENPIGLMHKADALFGLGKTDEAVETWHTYFDEIEETYQGHLRLGTIQILRSSLARNEGNLDKAKEELEKAVEHYQKVVELNDRNPFGHYYLGRIYIEFGELEKAQQHFKHRSVADNELGHTGMAVLYSRTGRPGLAEAEFERAKDISDEPSVVFWQEYAQFLMKQKKFKETVEALEKALEDSPVLKNEPALMRALEKAREKAGTEGESPSRGGTETAE